MKLMLKKNLIPLFLVLITIQAIANNLVHPVTPAFINQLNLNDYMFGVAYASMNTMMFIFSFYWADASNKMGMDKILFISLWGYAFSQIIFMNSSTELMIIIARLLAGVFAGGFMVGQMNFIVDNTSDELRGKTLTQYSILMIVASTAGYFIGGLLGDINIMIPFIVQIILLIFLGIIYLLFLRVTQHNLVYPSKSKINPFTSMKKGWAVLGQYGKLLFISILLIWISNTTFDSSFNYYIRDVLGFPPSYNGYLKAVIGVFTLISNMTLTFYLIRNTRLSQTIQRITLLLVFMFSLLIVVKELFWFIGIALILLAGLSIIQPIIQQSVSLLSKEKETVHYLMGFFNAMKSLGGIIGSLLAGFIYEVNVIGPFVLALLFMLLAFITMSIAERKVSHE